MNEEYLLPEKLKNLYEWLLIQNEKYPNKVFLNKEVTYDYNLTLPSNDRHTETTIRNWLKILCDYGLIKRRIKRNKSQFNKSKIYVFSFK